LGWGKQMSATRDRDDLLSDAIALIRRRRPGRSLETPFYLDHALFDLDMEMIFGRHWIHAGVEADVPLPGDYVTQQFGPYNIIVVRGMDHQVRAFHNVCRHRGARILHEPKGRTPRIVCRYHSWTYDLTGPLVFAEHMPADVEKSCIGLKPVHLKTVGGLLFICVAQTPPDDIDEMQAVVESYLGPHDLANCRIAFQTDIVEDGNWKIVMENNRECYHCSGHPELLRTFFQFFAHSESDVKPRQREYYERYRRITGEMHDIWEGQGLRWQLIDQLDHRPSPFRLERMPLDNEGESYTLDTKIASRRLLGNFTSPRLGALSLHTQPNSWNHFLSDHAVISYILPLSPEKTLLRTKWLVHKDAVEGQDYDLDNLTRVWRKTNEQDATYVNWTQAGVRTFGYEPGPFTPNENQLERFLGWYIEWLGNHLGISRPQPYSAAIDQQRGATGRPSDPGNLTI
jgi:glycine betaine catabolism A